MLTVGPCSRRVVTASQTAMAPATSGTSQITDSRRRRFTAALGIRRASSVAGFVPVVITVLPRVPDEPRIEGGGCEHGKDHDRRERGRAAAGLDRRELA